MKKFIVSIMFALSASLMTTTAMASGGVELEDAKVDIHNQPSLQRGAKYYVNYCMGCHSLNFSRYNRVAADLGLTEEQVAKNLIFTRDADGELEKPGALMKNGMSQKQSAEWFGAPPPDLSLVGRSRGSDWIYSYLKAFYVDPTRPLGANNTVFPNAGMPHVLWELQGWQEKHCTKGEGEHAVEHCELKLTKAGSMTPVEYDQTVRDITNFLTYVGEPANLHRSTYGIFTLLFLVLFAVVAYLLKKEYWKDVH
ncbi:ubiquinol-cytochrome c reductase cytochrome c1 subunit [Thiothrix caldifontis]|jgi:Cytochrome c1|uniref:Ubiquinol-cytochrome c reductase cytochrome c1 subunit n=1 Tax=Thiothrix caldifontis TaxID=525918 RepID=A0A1H4CS98_9GAMM|nr:cytochrome c1 [Thiothrix caldifontis]SEA63231.1 ubiquinol-cytochrome c reductase cytochrome c1 subunit [Thiothrix caldifontis]